VERKEWRWVALVTLALVIVSSLPYVLAWAAAPEDAQFTGLLVNPLDGHSYIAKMRQGLEGSWRFHLVFTPEPHAGAPVFLFYLVLGHLARWTGLPLVAIYHAGRVLAGAALLVLLYRLVTLLMDDRRQRRFTFFLLALSSGLGWLVAPLTGYLTADLWVPEAFTFYSILYNPHFPLAIGLMLVVFIALARPGRPPGWREGFVAVAASLGLGIVQPFGVIPVYATLAVWLALRWLRDRRLDRRTAGVTALVGLAAVAYPLYGMLAIEADPVLAAWNAQNQTPSPPVWDWLLSLGVLAALAIPGLALALRRRSDGDLLLVAWVLAVGVGMYAPLALQRRLALGVQTPAAILAAMGWWEAVRPRLRARRRGPAGGVVLGFSALTHGFLMGMLVLAALQGEPRFYLRTGEPQAFEWLREQVSHDQVVLCAPQNGMFVPAWAGQRVVYGHPFETVDAERREVQVEAYFAGAMSTAERESFLQENRVGYVLVGPRERVLKGGGVETGDWPVVFEAGDVRIYQVGER